MTQQAQIQLLAEALEEVGKMPHSPMRLINSRREWTPFDVIPCENEDGNYVRNTRVSLAALYGVAAEIVAARGYFIREWKQLNLWTLNTGDSQTHEFPTYPEALAAAVKIAGKEKAQ